MSRCDVCKRNVEEELWLGMCSDCHASARAEVAMGDIMYPEEENDDEDFENDE